ncbi:hypothetical protein SAMN05216241_103101 [Limimonas halophila]|uniref:UPF0235 protein SAMN05216241_103101 n=1 Tax=Limimonas halophila TaxID=1082479 RepID=A0A1G7PW87_9PROT|nr:DUF167 domain-containing protein [Limimonas halophila]SDF90501.1 hypothetical protein SAMN05216241_103101 [Limimonas halophila]
MDGPWDQLADGLRLRVRAQPGAKADRIDGLHAHADGRPALKVRVRAPAQDGKANTALTAFLAKRWGLKKADVTLTAGQTGRDKTVHLRGDPAELAARLAADCE